MPGAKYPQQLGHICASKAVLFFSVGCKRRQRFVARHLLVCPQDGTKLEEGPDALANVVDRQESAKDKKGNVGRGEGFFFVAGFRDVCEKDDVNHKLGKIFEDGHGKLGALPGLELLDRCLVLALRTFLKYRHPVVLGSNKSHSFHSHRIGGDVYIMLVSCSGAGGQVKETARAHQIRHGSAYCTQTKAQPKGGSTAQRFMKVSNGKQGGICL